MRERILVINPNSNKAVTKAMDEALGPLRAAPDIAIECETLAEGPLGIESQRDVDAVAPLVCRKIEAEAARTAAFVIACYSDPCLGAAREATTKPVFGIAQTGLATASLLGERIGVISILPSAVNRHWAYARALRIDGRIVADIAVNSTVADLQDERKLGARMLDVARELRQRHGADVIVLGCGGMARYRAGLEAELGVCVVDPTQAAVGAAVTAVRLGYRTLPR
jgi:Asp/Glu/hydantoin racemase